MKLIVGLGNPEDKYASTRHNLGFDVVDELVRKMGGGNLKVGAEDGKWRMEDKFKSEILKIKQCLLAKPQTYMNNSGIVVASIASFFKIKPEDIIIVHDDLDLPLGQVKIRLGGAGAGHHGVESVIDKLGTDKFVRLRLGIGNLRSLSGERNLQHFDAKAFVLEPFMPNEHSRVKVMLKRGVKALEVLVHDGVEKAQNQFNAK